MTGIFKGIANLFKHTPKTKQTIKFVSKQQQEQPIKPAIKVEKQPVKLTNEGKKQLSDGTQKGAAFMKKCLKGRAKQLMSLNTRRLERGLFAYN